MTNIFSSAADYAAKMFEAVVTFVGSFMSKSIKTSQRTFFPFQETQRAATQLLEWQKDENLVGLVERYLDDPIIRWKESMHNLVDSIKEKETNN